MFTGNKNKALFFKCMSYVIMPSEIMVNGEVVEVSDKTVY